MDETASKISRDIQRSHRDADVDQIPPVTDRLLLISPGRPIAFVNQSSLAIHRFRPDFNSPLSQAYCATATITEVQNTKETRYMNGIQRYVISHFILICIRKRRKLKEVTHGNNLHGRKGRKRCVQCRKWKQRVLRVYFLSNMKCVYESLETSCTVCQKRGLRCGVEEKVDGPKTQSREQQLQYSNQPAFIVHRSPPTPEDESLTDLDKMYFERLLETKCDFIITKDLESWVVCLKAIRFAVSMCTYRQYLIEVPMFPLVSKAVRYGYLTLASARLSRNPDDRWKYLGKFYHYTQEAIQNSSNFEVFVAACIGYYYELHIWIAQFSIKSGYFSISGAWLLLDKP